MENVLTYFEKNVLSYPDKIAIAYRDTSFTFSELKKYALKVSSCINSLKVVRKPILVLVDRDIYTIANFIGVLYSGNFYVPIDPELPQEKLEKIIDNSESTVIITDATHVDLINKTNFAGDIITNDIVASKRVDIDNFDVEFEKESDELYVVYTSGSTGVPKGVLKGHCAVISFIKTYSKTFNIGADEIIGNQTPFYFDASAKDIYMMIMLGCTIEILPSTLFTLPPELIDYMNEKKITFASWVPSVLSLVIQLNPFSLVKPLFLKKIFFVGEIMPTKHLNKWRDELPDIEYVNLYGQSEVAGVCTYYRVDKKFDEKDALPMGKPLDNCRIYLLDDDGQIIRTPGIVGEMYIVSDSLALGYYHDEERTKASFMKKNFGSGNENAFKTGDLAKYDELGNLVFAARNDYQIKHMGHRIELGEIELVANSLEAISRCCCIYDAEKKKIVLFCELVKDSQADQTEIRRELKNKLSTYMVPGKICILDKLPLNQNGKIDRQKLKEKI